MKAIEIENLSKSYDQIRALAKVSLSIAPGEVIGLLGPNGAGKTTLMKILTGYLEPDAGDVRVHGIDVVGDPISAQRRIGYLPESAPLYHDMLVQEYLEMLAAMRGVSFGDRKDRMIDAIRATGLEDRCTQPIGTLSKGYRQRVGIAQAIIHRPDVLILDEPTTGLDPVQIVEIRDMIKQLSATKGTTVLLSTHILSEVEATCQRVLVIMGGELRADANLADLRRPDAAVVAVEVGAEGVDKLLAQVEGVASVEKLGVNGDMQTWRVLAKTPHDLCPALFAALRGKPWKTGEVRLDPKTLERVFGELAAADLAKAKKKPVAAGKSGTPVGTVKSATTPAAKKKDSVTVKDSDDVPIDDREKYGKKAARADKAKEDEARKADTAETESDDKAEVDEKTSKAEKADKSDDKASKAEKPDKSEASKVEKADEKSKPDEKAERADERADKADKAGEADKTEDKAGGKPGDTQEAAS
jgi:ABC-2 type transport system ATP-binding protein